MPQIRSLHERQSGVLMHISSLPGPYFIGDLGKSAYEFIDFLKDSGQSLWQMLPVNPIGEGNSPYSTISSMAGEPLFIDLEEWQKIGLLSKSDLKKPKGNLEEKVDYKKALKFRQALWKKASTEFFKNKKFYSQKSFAEFKQTNQSWLDDFTLFCALTKKYKTSNWTKWPKGIKNRVKADLAKAREQFSDEINDHTFLQFTFSRQWQKLKNYASKKGIALVGDIPIFVAHESVDVWANQRFFHLKEDGNPKYVAGVPPDFFNRAGQLWGNALYDWQALKDDDFSYWIARLKRLTGLFDMIRLDHFIGFYRYWEIPANAKDARTGRWKLTPGKEFFESVRKHLGDLPFIAEDLGLMIPQVLELRDRFKLPGMRIMQFGFGKNASSNYYLPEKYVENCVAYTGTHDNNTCVGWYDQVKRERGKKDAAYNFAKLNVYLECDRKNVHEKMIEAVLESKANLGIIPAQDIFGLDGKAQMNKPGTPKGNWQWRMKGALAKKSVAKSLNNLVKRSKR